MYVCKLHKRPVQGIPDTYNDNSVSQKFCSRVHKSLSVGKSVACHIS